MIETPLELTPTPGVTAEGHARTHGDTWAWLRPRLAEIPITRVYDASPLGALPDLPVFCAVTPTARDLTVHSGKGLTPLAARISAAMEAVERVCAEEVDESRLVRASLGDLRRTGRRALDPAACALPYTSRWHPELEVDWIEGTSLPSGGAILVPLDLVISPAREGVCHGAETNGLASGNTHTEAVLHALYELVEREAASQDTFFAWYHDPAEADRDPGLIDSTALTDDCLTWAQICEQAGLQLILRVLTTDIAVAVIGATIVDRHFPGNEGHAITFGGLGADLDPSRAALRAITEAVQSHTGTLLGARDSFEGMRRVPDRAAMLLRRLETMHAVPQVKLATPRPLPSPDLLADVMAVLAELERVALGPCIAVSLTRELLGIPVVRVVVPGLAMPYGDSTRQPGRRLLRTIAGGRVR